MSTATEERVEPAADEETVHPPSKAELLRGFTWLSLVSTGGGTAAWARELFVIRRQWMTDDQYLQARALSQILPGPNMLNFATYVGSHFHGFMGAVLALVGLTAIPIVCVMSIGLWYLHGGLLPSTHAVFGGLAAAAAGASAGTGLSSARKHVKEPVFDAIALGVLVLVGFLRFKMIPVTLGAIGLSLIIYSPRRKA